MKIKNVVKTFEPNLLGRDFVIGDLHGSLSCFTNLLKNLNFDETTDRMFSVGDLTDRGPDSLGTLRLLQKPWFHCTLSNHEQMMLEAFNGGYMGQYWFRNGGTWGMEALSTFNALERNKCTAISNEEQELFDLLKVVEELPFLITINHKNGKKFHILHAELPPGKNNITDADLTVPDLVHNLATTQGGDGDSFLWARYQFGPFYRAQLADKEKLIRTAKYYKVAAPYNDELSHIISGHTILQQPITLVGQTNIDTCAYGSYDPVDSHAPKWCALTCICLDDWSFVQATETEFKNVEPLVINRSDLKGENSEN